MSNRLQGLLKMRFYYGANGLYYKKDGTGFKKDNRAGCVTWHGYRLVEISGKKFMEHHLVWAYHNGVLPKEIDHINHKRQDNRIENLREVSRSDNAKNQSMHKNNTSGFMGVSWCKRTKKWQVHLSINKRHTFLGRFTELDDAIEARVTAMKKYNYHENHGECYNY